MIAIQKITSLGFSLHDGMHRPADSLLDYQKRTAIRRMPSLLEYLAYVLQFPTLMSGPMITYHDYIEFVEGSAFTKHISIEELKQGNKPSPIVR
jgi:D-alanyl-lipoteichoic acid acyltransferase DltB (MBOAT superfamily)